MIHFLKFPLEYTDEKEYNDKATGFSPKVSGFLWGICPSSARLLMNTDSKMNRKGI